MKSVRHSMILEIIESQNIETQEELAEQSIAECPRAALLRKD